MSTHWGYRCEACDDESGRYNHGDDMLAATMRLVPQIRALQAAQGASWLEITLMGDGHGALAFLLDHYDHGVTLVNEYGAVRLITALGEG